MPEALRYAGLAAVVLVACSSPDAGGGPPSSGDGGTPPGAEGAPPVTDAPAPPPMGDAPHGADVAREATPDGPVPIPPSFVYVGATDSQIHLYTLDAATGALTAKATYPTGQLPSFLAFDAAHNRLLSTNENGNAIQSFAVDRTTGALTPSGMVGTGAGPTFVALDSAGRFAMTADYGGGAAQVFPVAANGSLGNAVATVMPGTNPHCFVLDAANHFAFVAAKGSDLIAQYTFDGTSGALAPNPNGATVPTAAGAGPRHIAFHPTAPLAYVIAENASTMTAYQVDTVQGTLTPTQTISTLPSGFSGTNTGAEVAVAPSGNFVYGSNRGSDTIVVFATQTSGSAPLSVVGFTPTGGKTPRQFTLDTTGQLLLVGNQDSNDVVAFRVDTGSGMLTQLMTTDVGASPYFVLVVPVQ